MRWFTSLAVITWSLLASGTQLHAQYCAPTAYHVVAATPSYYNASWYYGRWYPAGHYSNVNGAWYRHGYGYEYGYAYPPPPPAIVVPTVVQQVQPIQQQLIDPNISLALGVQQQAQVDPTASLLRELLLRQQLQALLSQQQVTPSSPLPVQQPPVAQTQTLSFDEIIRLRQLLQQSQQTAR